MNDFYTSFFGRPSFGDHPSNYIRRQSNFDPFWDVPRQPRRRAYAVDPFTGEPVYARRRQYEDSVDEREAYRQAQEAALQRKQEAIRRRKEALKRQKAEEERKRAIALQRYEQAATTIQSTFRGWQTRRKNILEQLKTLRDISDNANSIVDKYAEDLLRVEEIAEQEKSIENLSKRDLLLPRAFEEELLKQLFRLDAIQTFGCPLLRNRRKEIVSELQRILSDNDRIKKLLSSLQ
mmetsp:Transcript_29428/g.32728  ORF Transcript_29428/g.32728 Transcript_29428/m.32728 type:complete len:235 (-) Transcript_29428:130-834(-)|eukprot:CAMPEP_0168509654 /NCGR_PEP_ID=MMETSP0405-20121227/925_1 /TAXON_ID=498012 /ORGANISM="Trichosphaerium sp, Strain Am-I-7 wt" /LENGTH=234 /DNA_ID=CAMNT_0008527195 /DNA_START=512 /DNA_END=1216 /DNA_ORIENTATION=-